MTPAPTAVVFDCMVYAQAMISPHGPAGACFQLVRSGDIRLMWSDYVLQKVRELPGKLLPRLKLTAQRTEAFISSIAPFAAHIVHIVQAYENPFDPDDSHYINLALASDASLITSRDGDLLRLMDQTRPESREFLHRFPRMSIIQPEQLLILIRR